MNLITMYRKWKGTILLATFLVVIMVFIGCSSGPTPAPASTPSMQQLVEKGTVLIAPGSAEGFSLDDAGIALNCHIKFRNNVPYSVDVHVVREMYPFENRPSATNIEDYFKDVVTSTNGKSGELVVGSPFLKPPYTVWFVNNTSNTDFEVEYEIYWD